MTTTTTNYGWVKPDVGASDDVWGGYINTDLDGVDSVVKGVSVVANAAYPASNPSGYQTAAQVASVVIGDNRIINGDMRIDQRNSGAAGGAVNSYTVDRWYYNASQAGKISWQRGGAAGSGAQSASGCPYYLVGAVSAAYTAAATEVFAFRQPIEADMISDFAWGQANAQPVTLSFWVNGTVPGTYGGCIASGVALGGAYPFTFPVTSAWTKVVITIPPPTVGTWTLAGNAIGATVYFDLGNGANFRGPPNVWSTSDYRGANGTVNLLATLNAALYVTGVKLEIGSVATPFNRQSLAKSMADCQRYYQVGNLQLQWVSSGVATYTQRFPFAVQMRAAPTMVWNAGATTGGTGSVATSIPNNYQYNCSVTVVAGNGVNITGSFTADAEL